MECLSRLVGEGFVIACCLRLRGSGTRRSNVHYLVAMTEYISWKCYMAG